MTRLQQASILTFLNIRLLQGRNTRVFFKANITALGPEKQIRMYTRQLQSGEYLPIYE